MWCSISKLSLKMDSELWQIVTYCKVFISSFLYCFLILDLWSVQARPLSSKHLEQFTEWTSSAWEWHRRCLCSHSVLLLYVADKSRTWCLWKTYQPTGRDHPKEKSSNWWWSTSNKWANTGLLSPQPSGCPLGHQSCCCFFLSPSFVCLFVCLVRLYFNGDISIFLFLFPNPPIYLSPLQECFFVQTYLLQCALPGGAQPFFCLL